ncbi:MAG TPA: alginate lyase family protein [Rhizomicrobium sp.]
MTLFSSSPRVERLAWYANRLARMSPAEMAHRACEQMKRARDARRAWSWNRFGQFESSIGGVPGLDAPMLLADAFPAGRDSAAATGRFTLLHREWPEPGSDWTQTIWHLDPVTGNRWPGVGTFAFAADYRHAPDKGDVKFVWEINRLGFLQRLAASAGDDSEKWDLIEKILRGWMDANPPFQGINWTSGIEAASRLATIIVVLGFAGARRRAALSALVKPFVEAHAWWIDRYPSLHSSANNHRVAELAALFLAAICVPRLPHAARYLRLAHAGLEAEILKQFYADGVGAEQSPTYAAYSLEWFALAGIVADESGAPFAAAYRERAAAAANHLRWMMDDGGNVPQIGDDDEGRVLQFHAPSYVASVANLVSRWLKTAAAQIPVGLRRFGDGGYSVLRERIDGATLLLVFDHGKLGFLSIAAHGHADALGIWLHWGDEPILIDAGTYLYHAGARERDRLRGTPAHNTLTIEGADQSRISGPFGWSAHSSTRFIDDDGCIAAAENNGYERRYGLRHRRTVSRTADRLFLVEDQLIGRAKRAGLRWRIGFLVGPSVNVETDRGTALLQTRNGRRLSLVLEEPPAAVWRIEKTTCSPAFNTQCETIRLEASGIVPTNGRLKIRTSLQLC